MVALVLDGLVGFPAGLSPTSFYLSPTSFHLSPKLGACGRVRGWLVSHFLSFVSHFFSFVSQFFSFVSQAGCLWSGSRLACLPLPFICLPLLFICLPVLFICLPGWVPTSFHSPNSLLLGVLNALKNGRLGAGWSGRVPSRLVSHFLCLPVLFSHGSRLACLPLPFICIPILFIVFQATSFHLSPTSFHCLPGWVLVVGFRAGLSPTSFHLSPTSFHLSPRLGACGRVSGQLVSHFLSFVSHFFSACGRVPGRLVSHFLFFSFVSHFFSFVSQAGCLWSRLACLPPSFHSRCLWSGSRLACLPLPFICLPGWVLVVEWSPWCWRVPGWLVSHFLRLSPTSCHFSPKLGACGPHFLSFVSHFFSFVSHFFSLSPRLGACGRVPGRLVSHFFSFVSQAGCLWSGFRPACLPLPFICLPLLFCLWSGSRPACLSLPLICLPLLFICHQLLFICLPGWVLVVGFPPYTCFHLSPGSFRLSPRNASFVSRVRHCWCHVAFLFICLCHC